MNIDSFLFQRSRSYQIPRKRHENGKRHDRQNIESEFNFSDRLRDTQSIRSNSDIDDTGMYAATRSILEAKRHPEIASDDVKNLIDSVVLIKIMYIV